MVFLLLMLACTADPQSSPASDDSDEVIEGGDDPVADVVGVTVTGDPGSWTFSVSIRSDETGCAQYADWWEILTPEGDLLYRRILRHSHPDEQPFTRAAEQTLDLGADQRVIARAHLSTTGFGGGMFEGGINDGFQAIEANPDLFADLEGIAPLPDDCLF